MHQSKRKIKKDSSFNDLVANGFARKTTSSSTDGSTWNLVSHYGVYHPCKPGKIRVMFDCIAEFHGTSLNKELLLGPDITSQLVGLFTRFRTEEVAFMGNIEAIFHQVHIPKKKKKLS